MAEGISVSGLNKSNFTLVDFGRALHSANNFSCLAFRLGNGKRGSHRSLSDLAGVNTVVGDFSGVLFSLYFWSFFMATVSKFISHNLAGTNWQAQVAAVKRKFIIYVNSFCAICTVQQERHTWEREKVGERETAASFLPNYAKSSLQAAGAKAHLSQLSRG